MPVERKFVKTVVDGWIYRPGSCRLGTSRAIRGALKFPLLLLRNRATLFLGGKAKGERTSL